MNPRRRRHAKRRRRARQREQQEWAIAKAQHRPSIVSNAQPGLFIASGAFCFELPQTATFDFTELFDPGRWDVLYGTGTIRANPKA